MASPMSACGGASAVRHNAIATPALASATPATLRREGASTLSIAATASVRNGVVVRASAARAEVV